MTEKKVLVLGVNGTVGTALRKLWKERNHVFYPDKAYGSLLDYSTMVNLLKHTYYDVVINLAGRVGGIKANIDNMAEFAHQNLLIGTNVLRAAHVFNVPKVISMLSTCIYPDKIEYPIYEESLHSGPPNNSNYGYAYAKRMIEVLSRSYRDQYNHNFICLIPTNIYGGNDNFNLENGHFIAAAIRKIYEAKINDYPYVDFWSNGYQLRQFTYVDDIAKIIDWSMDYYNSGVPLNIGNENEYSLRDIIDIIVKYFHYKGQIKWSTENWLSGQYRKPVSMQRLKDHGYNLEENTVHILDGLTLSCEWFEKNYPNNIRR